MWKLLGIILILWELLADYLEPIITSRFGKLGLSLYGIVLLYSRLREKAENRILEERVTALEEGKRWNGNTKKSCGPLRTSLRKLFSLSPAAWLRDKRRNNKLRIDKLWLVAFFVFVGGLLSKQFDLQLPEGYAEWAADAVMAISAIVMGYRNMTKQPEPEHPFDGGVANEPTEHTYTASGNR